MSGDIVSDGEAIAAALVLKSSFLCGEYGGGGEATGSKNHF